LHYLEKNQKKLDNLVAGPDEKWVEIDESKNRAASFLLLSSSLYPNVSFRNDVCYFVKSDEYISRGRSLSLTQEYNITEDYINKSIVTKNLLNPNPRRPSGDQNQTNQSNDLSFINLNFHQMKNANADTRLQLAKGRRNIGLKRYYNANIINKQTYNRTFMDLAPAPSLPQDDGVSEFLLRSKNFLLTQNPTNDEILVPEDEVEGTPEGFSKEFMEEKKHKEVTVNNEKESFSNKHSEILNNDKKLSPHNSEKESNGNNEVVRKENIIAEEKSQREVSGRADCQLAFNIFEISVRPTIRHKSKDTSVSNTSAKKKLRRFEYEMQENQNYDLKNSVGSFKDSEQCYSGDGSDSIEAAKINFDKKVEHLARKMELDPKSINKKILFNDIEPSRSVDS
jgi:hypothetical protein